MGLETTLKRPIVNTRDEPHADPHRYRRLHVIVGDANLAEVATFLKLGTTVAGAGHDRGRRHRPAGAWPWPTRCGPCTQWPSTGPSPSPLPMADGSTATALDIQWELYSLARKYADDRGPRLPRRRGGGRGRSSTGGSRSSTGSRPTRCRWPARSTGWPSSSCSRPTGTATAATGTTTGWPPSTCSTTTCGPARSLFARLDTETPGRRRTRWPPPSPTPPEHPGLVPGGVPQALARVGGHRQLGLPGLRPRHRPPAARPYDGSAEGNGGTCRSIYWTAARARPSWLDRLSS